MHLQVLPAQAVPEIDVYRPAPFDLDLHPLRPGLSHESVQLVLEPRLADGVERAAAADGLPTSLWAGIAIESERALGVLARDTNSETAALASFLDDAAFQRYDGLVHQRGRRLVRYALAVRGPAPREREQAQRPLIVPVAQHSLIAWELAAGAEGETVEQWAAKTVARLPANRGRWESAAALAGQTLGEWIAAQAARRSSD